MNSRFRLESGHVFLVPSSHWLRHRWAGIYYLPQLVYTITYYYFIFIRPVVSSEPCRCEHVRLFSKQWTLVKILNPRFVYSTIVLLIASHSVLISFFSRCRCVLVFELERVTMSFSKKTIKRKYEGYKEEEMFVVNRNNNCELPSSVHQLALTECQVSKYFNTRPIVCGYRF